MMNPRTYLLDRIARSKDGTNIFIDTETWDKIAETDKETLLRLVEKKQMKAHFVGA